MLPGDDVFADGHHQRERIVPRACSLGTPVAIVPLNEGTLNFVRVGLVPVALHAPVDVLASFRNEHGNRVVGVDLSRRIGPVSNSGGRKLRGRRPQALNQNGIEHLLVDLPSVDREEDQGRLSAHKAFWGMETGPLRINSTITELIYVPDEIPDGLYLLNLQVMNLANDAAPSRPVLYALIS